MHSRIASEENNKIKLVKKLRSKKSRDSIGKFSIEGINLVSEAVRRRIPLDFILVSESAEVTREISELLIVVTCDTYAVPDRIFDRATDAEHGVQVIAVLPKLEPANADDNLLKPEDNILILDRIQDPGNMGTILRTAYAAGYKRIFAMKGTVDIYSSKVLRATVGTIFDLPVVYVDDIDSLMQIDEVRDRRLSVTVPESGLPYYECDLCQGTALVIGNEGNGISSELINAADVKVNIPMREGIESLNAAISAAILMYESVRAIDKE